MNQFPEIHVLLVDDSPSDRDLVARQLAQVKQLRGTTELCDRLATAMARLERGGIDVVLLDVGLPDSQGLDTVLAIRNAFPAVAIVVLTGVESDDFGLRAIQHGADDYLEKGNMQVENLARALQYSIVRKRASSTDSQLQVARDMPAATVPGEPAAGSGIRYRGRLFFGGNHIGRLFRLPATRGRFFGCGHRGRQRTRLRSSSVDGGNKGVPAGADAHRHESG